MSDIPKEAAEPGKRVYEYIDNAGNTFWSFVRLPARVSSSRRLVLQSRVGSHLTNHLVDLRRKGASLSGYREDPDLP